MAMAIRRLHDCMVALSASNCLYRNTKNCLISGRSMAGLSVALHHKQFHLLRSNTMPRKKAAQTQDKCSHSALQGPIIANSSGTVTVNVLAKPNAKESCITGITPEGVSIQIAAPPVDGEANSELVKYLSKVLGLRKSDVSLARGSKSRAKSFIISGMTKDDVEAKLASHCDHS